MEGPPASIDTGRATSIVVGSRTAKAGGSKSSVEAATPQAKSTSFKSQPSQARENSYAVSEDDNDGPAEERNKSRRSHNRSSKRVTLVSKIRSSGIGKESTEEEMDNIENVVDSLRTAGMNAMMHS